jgi:hypothetical protein
MSSGEITCNTANMGGGVFYTEGNKGIFTRSGGEIFDNTATDSPYVNDLGSISVHPNDPYNNPLLHILFIVIAIVVVVALLFYRSKKQKQAVT